MEQPILPQQKRRSAALLIVALSIIIIGLIGVLIWCWFYKGHPSGGSGGGGSPAPVATGPCFEGAENTLPAGFTFYENAPLGFKFAYPSGWGTVSVATTPMGGVGGHYLMGSFSANPNVTFGGNATDYIVAGRDGIPTDNPGYLQASSKFYSVQLWTFHPSSGPDEPQEDLYPIAEPSTLKNGCNAKGLVTQYPASILLDYSYDVVRFNLQPTNLYYGVNFVFKNPDAALRADIDKIVGTFQLIP